MGWYLRERERGRGRPKDKWDKEMRLACGGSTWQRVTRDTKEWKRIGTVYRVGSLNGLQTDCNS